MEANAPEKIYLQPSTIGQLPHQNIAYTNPLSDKSIEYIRKDAFIEKASEWMKLYVLNHDVIDIFEMEDDFKNYMKGE